MYPVMRIRLFHMLCLFSEYLLLHTLKLSATTHQNSIHYHTALCHLLQPLVPYTQFSQPTRDHLRTIVNQNAKAGLNLLKRYRELYSNRYQPPLQAFCLVHLADTFIRYSPSGVERQEAVRFCLDMLKECQPGLVIAGPLQAMFCQTVLECGAIL